MASICISSCVEDVRLPLRPTYANLYKWPESDAEFVRWVSSDCNGGSGLAHPRIVEGISCRQMYLKSYTFSRKETVQEITKKCFAKVKEKIKNGRKKKNEAVAGMRKCLVLRKAKDVSRAAMLSVSRRLLSCAAKVDISGR